MVSGTFASTTHIAAPIDVVWSVMVDHQRYGNWGKAKVRMEREGTPSPNGLGAIRCFHAGPVKVYEEVTAWEPPRRMSYRLNSKQFTKQYSSDMVLREENGATVLEWTSTFEPRFPGTTSLVVRLYASSVRAFAEGIKRESEAAA